MSTVSRIEDFFSPQKLIDICEANFRPLSDKIKLNIRLNTTNSGKPVNDVVPPMSASNVPAATSGETERSLRTESGSIAGGYMVSFVGREYIANLDRGTSPADARAQFGTFGAFLSAITTWARTKEAKYGLPNGYIKEQRVASAVWTKGTVLYQAGGGTETISELLPPVLEEIDKQVAEELSDAVYKLLESSIKI